jgi:hypothetical protein
MLRRLLIITTAASAMLCLVSAGLWARSLGNFERLDLRYVRCPQPDELHTFYLGFSWYSNTFRLHLARRTYAPVHFRGKPEEWKTTLQSMYPRGLHCTFLDESITQFFSRDRPGFRARHYQDVPSEAYGDRWMLAVRPWLPTLLTAALPTIWCYRRLSAASWQFGLRQLLWTVSLLAVVLATFTWLMK